MLFKLSSKYLCFCPVIYVVFSLCYKKSFYNSRCLMQKPITGKSTKYKYLRVFNCEWVGYLTIYTSFNNKMEDEADRIESYEMLTSKHAIANEHIYNQHLWFAAQEQDSQTLAYTVKAPWFLVPSKGPLRDGGYWGTKHHCSLGIWPPVDFSCHTESPHTPVHVDSGNWTQGLLITFNFELERKMLWRY